MIVQHLLYEIISILNIINDSWRGRGGGWRGGGGSGKWRGGRSNCVDDADDITIFRCLTNPVSTAVSYI